MRVPDLQALTNIRSFAWIKSDHRKYDIDDPWVLNLLLQNLLRAVLVVLVLSEPLKVKNGNSVIQHLSDDTPG